MSPYKILFVDDEPMSLKYFDRLVSPLAPVITASSVDQAKGILAQRAAEIAVIVSDQRMPGTYGNELLRFAREFHPGIVRVLTTAYSELGEAIEAVNSGEIYRYITKPWDVGSLHADLRNALEHAELRNQRDFLVREKLLVQHRQILGNRLATLAMLGAGCVQGDSAPAMHRFARAAALVGCSAPATSWHQWDFAILLQAETQRGIAIALGLRQWHTVFGNDRTTERAFALLAQALGTKSDANVVTLTSPSTLTGLLTSAVDKAPLDTEIAWLAWLLWWNAPIQVKNTPDGWTLQPVDASIDGLIEPVTYANWLERMIGELIDQ